MKIIAIEHEVNGVTPDDFRQYLKEEALAVYGLCQRGEIREIYFRADRDEAVLVLECESVNEANMVLATLPLVKQGLIKFDLIPLRAYPGFSRLFKES